MPNRWPAGLTECVEETVDREVFASPSCSRECAVETDFELLNLQGRIVEIEYLEPRCHCRPCRRDFLQWRGCFNVQSVNP